MTILLPLFLFLLPLTAVIAPRGLCAQLDIFGALCGLFLVHAYATRQTLRDRFGQGNMLHRVQPRLIWRDLRWVIAALAFTALSACWSASPRALEMLRDTSLVTIAGMLAFTASHLWAPHSLDRALRLFAVAFLLALLGFAIHAALGYPLIMRQFDIANLATLDGTNIVKRSVAALALFVWPAALAVRQYAKRWPWHLALLLLTSMSLLSVALPSRSATLGLLAGLALFGLAARLPGAARRIGFVMLPLAMPLMLLTALALPQLPSDWPRLLPTSGALRLGIWNYAAQQSLAHLPLGIGIDGSRSLAAPVEQVAAADGTTNSALPDHPHNVFLQLWLEGGLVGAALAIWLCFCLWRRLCRLPQELQPFAFGYAATALVTLGIAYGTWQAWWLAAHVWAAFLLALLTRQAQRPGDDATGHIPGERLPATGGT